ncbi:MAG: Stk1 family PASTA domain-containing Ser/Thr kinase [Solirubrobacterales bacterium]
MNNHLLGNRYEIIAKIGDGGMATVYKARCTLLDRIVAVKVLKDELAGDKNFVMKFRSEAQAAAKISHPNIVNIYDVGEDRGLNFIVMEYIEGCTLKEVIQKTAPMADEEVIRNAAMICDALTHAHAKGIVHRDIKPHNILVTSEGNVKVADFGIARAVGGGTVTYSGMMIGSVHYVAPEQAQGDNVDARTDLYSLGCVMYEMTTGQVPFEADSAVTIALKHMHEEAVPPSAINAKISPKLEQVIQTAMAKDPDYRFQSAQELKNALYSQVPLKPAKPEKGKNKRDNERTLVGPAIRNNRTAAAGKRRISSMGYVVIIGALLSVLGGFLFGMRDNFFGTEIEVPNVTGLTIKEAAESLEDEKLKMEVRTEVNSTDVPVNHIVSQIPAANSKVKEGRTIQVTVSKGAEVVVVPDITGKSMEDASSILKEEGLSLGEVGKTEDPEIPEGQIASQSPQSGEKVKAGSEIDITVSAGKTAENKMRNVVGMYLSEARTTLVDGDGLTVEITKTDSESYFPGQVISQTPASGQSFTKGQKVSLVVSKGPGPLPKQAAIDFTMPDVNDYAVLSVVVQDVKGRREIYNDTHSSGYVFSRRIEYYGKATVVFYVDGQEIQSRVLN